MPAKESTRRDWVLANIEVSEELLGDASRYKHVVFDNLPCGALRLDVGHYYLVFTKQNNETLRLVPADPSVLNITREYIPGMSEQNYTYLAPSSTLAFIRGEVQSEAMDPLPYLEFTGVASGIDCDVFPR